MLGLISAINKLITSLSSVVGGASSGITGLLAALKSATVGVQVDISSAHWTGTATRAVICENAGLLLVDFSGTGSGIYVPVAAGVPIAISVVKIYKAADGTTVTGKIVALS